MWHIDSSKFTAIAFDLDGVVTDTVSVHAAAWKRLFDEIFARHAVGGAWRPFSIETDYRRYVDGKPRRDGLRAMLDARGIAVPEGAPGDSADAQTIHGLAARKNAYVHERLARGGVDVFDDAVWLLDEARRHGLRTAVVTASENCEAVLQAAGLREAFEVRVDGNDLGRLSLRGKPAPDSFLEAARRLGAVPRQVVVLEDAIAGVQAGRAGDFGLVVGVARSGGKDALVEAGADVAVASLRELAIGSEHQEAHPR